MSEARSFCLRAVALIAAAGMLLAACGSDAEGGDGPDCANGTACPPCVGDGCLSSAATATDGQKNATETDVDCGGANAPKCADGKGCVADSDCANTYCRADAKTCATPRPDDGVKNADETDVDCGGAAAPKCALDKGCSKHDDCTSGACSYANKCIANRSCVLHHGGDTCGPSSAQGDCCESIEVPRAANAGGPYTLDKYLVTAGRMRAFIESTKGDIRGWVQANRPKGFDPKWDDYLPSTLDDPEDGSTGYGGVYQQLGPWALYGSGAEPANRGCNVEGPGARTYWVPDEINERWKDKQRYAKDDLDEKALNCVTHYMLQAFCAWDGGRVPTVAEISYVLTNGGTTTYPWGNAPPPNAFNDAHLDAATAGTPPAASKYANHGYNWWSPARLIDGDYSVFIAPPGRFPDGNGKWGHADLGGTVLEWVGAIAGGNAAMFWNGSWEAVHPTQNATLATPAAYKYYATGGRCAR